MVADFHDSIRWCTVVDIVFSKFLVGQILVSQDPGYWMRLVFGPCHDVMTRWVMNGSGMTWSLI